MVATYQILLNEWNSLVGPKNKGQLTFLLRPGERGYYGKIFVPPNFFTQK